MQICKLGAPPGGAAILPPTTVNFAEKWYILALRKTQKTALY